MRFFLTDMVPVVSRPHATAASSATRVSVADRTSKGEDANDEEGQAMRVSRAGCVAAGTVLVPPRRSSAHSRCRRRPSRTAAIRTSSSRARRRRRAASGETSSSFVSSAAGAFTTRFTSLVTADSDGAGAAPASSRWLADYQIDFTVTAPGRLRLTVDTRSAGDMHLVNDGERRHRGRRRRDGFSTGGTADVGHLDLRRPGHRRRAAAARSVGIVDELEPRPSSA